MFPPEDAARLEEQIEQWRSYLRRRQAIHSVDVAELEDHLREQVAVLSDAGLDSDEAFLVAVKRMGDLDALSREFAREHSERLWKQLVVAPSETYEPQAAADGGDLFSGTIASGPANSVFINSPGTFNGKTVNFNRIPAVHYFDFATRFNVNEHFDLTFSVSNLFDKQPPLVGSTVGSTSFNSGNTYPSTYDALGRRFAIGANLHF